jgi:type III pantothenate kinase
LEDETAASGDRYRPNIVLGLYQGKKLVTHWRLRTEAERTADEYGVIISQLISSKGFRTNQIDSIVASCVVPPMVSVTQELATKFFELEPLMVGPGIKTGMPILYDSPKDVGADRIVNGIAAYEKYRDACIVVDFGTATTVILYQKGEYVGALSRQTCVSLKHCSSRPRNCRESRL